MFFSAIQGEMQLMCLFVLRSDGHTSPVTSGVEIKPNIIYARAENHHEQQLLFFGLRDKFLECRRCPAFQLLLAPASLLTQILILKKKIDQLK